jgi:expansin (peptidoglycan-binding protein)
VILVTYRHSLGGAEEEQEIRDNPVSGMGLKQRTIPILWRLFATPITGSVRLCLSEPN